MTRTEVFNIYNIIETRIKLPPAPSTPDMYPIIKVKEETIGLLNEVSSSSLCLRPFFGINIQIIVISVKMPYSKLISVCFEELLYIL